jgi:Fe2+ transport system protein B
MFKQATLAGLYAVSVSTTQLSSPIDEKAILDWCFVIGSLDLGVIGFLYSTYATAKFSDTHSPPIVKFLRQFINALVFVLVVLSCLAIATAYRAAVPFSAWLIVACLSFVAAWSIGLAWRLD